jgi:hypothetical protein
MGTTPKKGQTDLCRIAGQLHMSYIWQKQQTEPGMIIFVKSMEQAVL